MQKYLNKVSKESGVDMFVIQRMYDRDGFDRLSDNIETYIWDYHSLAESNEIGMSNPHYEWKYTTWEKM